MVRRMLLVHMATLAKRHGKEFAQRHGRPLGEKLATKLSNVGVKRGLLDEPLDLDEVLRRLKAVRDAGGISREDFANLAREVKERMRNKQ